jgi:hypothetical protein
MHNPGPPLARFIAYFWALHDVPVHATGRLVPSGTLDLLVNLHEDEVRIDDPLSGVCHVYSGAVAAGAYGPFLHHSAGPANVCATQPLRPGARNPRAIGGGDTCAAWLFVYSRSMATCVSRPLLACRTARISGCLSLDGGYGSRVIS